MKTGVVIHGCNLHIENWRHVAWGDPPNRIGRIPHGIAVAHQFDAAVIVMGTGASSEPFHFGEDPDDDIELPEAQYSLRYLKEFFADITEFESVLNQLGAAGTPEFNKTRDQLLGRIVLDLKSQNTAEEITNAADIFLEMEVERIILVSSPSHVIRALRDASDIFSRESRFARYQDKVLASPSVTCYEGSTPADVVVIEPPHRPDRHVLPTHRRIQRMLDLQKMSGDELVSLIEDFDQLLQRYEHRFYRSQRKT